MKQFITVTGCVILLMALLCQFVQNQKILMALEAGSHAVDRFCEIEDERALRLSLSRIMDCGEEEVHIEKENGRWEIKVPVKQILAAPAFWGVLPEENKGIYKWEREHKNE